MKGIGLDAGGEIYLLGTKSLGPQGTTGVVLKLIPPAIYAQGAAVPGAGSPGGVPAGATFAAFGIPAINDAGDIAVDALLAIGAVTRRAILGPKGDDRSTFSVLVSAGDPAPGPAGTPLEDGEVFAAFEPPLLNAGSRVAFVARMRSRSGVPAAAATGVWTNADTGVLRLVARAGEPAPGAPGARFHAFASVALGDPGTAGSKLAFTAVLVHRTGVAGLANDEGLWISEAGGAPALVLRESQVLAVRGRSEKVKSFQALSFLPSASGQGHGVAGDGVVARVVFHSGAQAVIRFAATEDYTAIAVTGDAAADTAFQNFAAVTQSTDGRPAFISTLQDLWQPKRTAIFAQAPDLSWETVAERGTLAAGTDGLFSRFHTAVHSRDAGVAFLANVAGGTSASANNTGVWWQRGTSLALLAREGAPAVGVTGAKWTHFRSIALPDGAAAGPLILADLRVGGAVTAANRAGLWASDAAGELHLVLRAGVEIRTGDEFKTLRAFTVLGAVPRSPAQTRSFNGQRQLVYRAYFTDGSQAILTASLP